MRLHRFHGGLQLTGHKAEAAARPILQCPLPERLVVPLLQHAGEPARALVAVGDEVAEGQLIGAPVGDHGAAVHAPAAGRIEAIEARQVPHPSLINQPCAVIRVSQSQPRHALPPLADWQDTDPATLVDRIRQCGIVGLGGGAFPTASKLAVQRQVLILNGAECEPWIACDDSLLRERAAEVLAGACLLRHVTGAGRVLLAVEDRMVEAIAALRAARGIDDPVELVAVPTVYPQGGERQLIRVLTGREVPRGGLPRDVGCLVQNVATAAACWRAVTLGEPLIRRIVSVTGRGVARPGNFEVALGTPIGHLIEAAGGYTPIAARLLQGGPLMGHALPHDDLPIVKGSNCILVLAEDDIRDAAPELPCIRCGSCAEACPANLLPQQLLAFARAGQDQRLREHGLFDCIECGCCDLVCPSHIPLVEHYRFAKTDLRVREREGVAAAAAKRRHEARAGRMRRDIDEREARQLARREATSAESVQAAIERAQARRDPESST